MPEATLDQPSSGAVSHDSNPTAPTGIDRMMAQLDTAVASGKTVDTSPKPVSAEPPAAPTANPESGKPATPPAAAAKPETKPVAPPQQQAQPEPDWSKAPPKWHKIYEDHKTKTNEQIRSLEGKLKSLESKPFEQPGDAKKIEAYEKRLAELQEELGGTRQKLIAKDYTQSDDYKQNFVEPANAIYQKAIDFVGRLRVNGRDGERQATQADFDYLRSLPLDVRAEQAEEMFGKNAMTVMRFTDDIDRLRDSAELASRRHAQMQEKTSLEREGKTKQEQQYYQEQYKSALQGLQEHEQHGKWFKDDPNDPEGSKMFQDYLGEIERLSSEVDKLPADQKAGYNAFWKASAAAFPRALLENTRLQEKIAAIEEELEKYRKTDPGAAGSQGVAAAGGAPKRMGIDEAVAAFDQIPTR